MHLLKLVSQHLAPGIFALHIAGVVERGICRKPDQRYLCAWAGLQPLPHALDITAIARRRIILNVAVGKTGLRAQPPFEQRWAEFSECADDEHRLLRLLP